VPCVSGVDKQGPRAHAHRRDLGARLGLITCRSATSRTGQSAVDRRVLGARGGRTMPSCPPVSAGFMGHRICRPPDRARQDRQPNHSRRRDRRPAGRPIAGPSTGTADGSPAVDRSTTSRPHPDNPAQAIAPRPPQHRRTAARRNRGPRSAGPSTTAPPTVSGGADRLIGRTVRRWSRTRNQCARWRSSRWSSDPAGGPLPRDTADGNGPIGGISIL
jgi:hypothetical protein